MTDANGTGLSETPLTKALEVAVPVCAGPPVGTGQLARIHTLEVSPAVTRSGLSWTWIVGLVVVVVGLGVPVAVLLGVPALVAGVVGVPLAVGVGVGVDSAEAEQPVRPTMTMAPAYATRLTLSTGRHPTFAVLHQASTQNVDVAPPDTHNFWVNP
ncbi:hypothetical protein GCM10022419_004510 [Nonomuraea rosea]|uniref:Uncharacterized protein n=1 Tax=Nonomuraea rosea TaxID=638574 RepID=A0ABP6V7Z9_9ACTN